MVGPTSVGRTLAKNRLKEGILRRGRAGKRGEKEKECERGSA